MKKMTSAHTFTGILLLGFVFTGLVSCKKDEPVGSDEPIALPCNYFSENPNAVLKDNPNAPVDYKVSCQMQINDDVTIDPGVTIAFETDAGFAVMDEGSLKSNGTSQLPVTCTGVNKTPGAWAGLYFESNDVKNELLYTTVEYAGGANFNSNDDRAGVIVYADARLKMANSRVTHSATYGLNANYNSTTLILNNNVYTKNNIPVWIDASLVGMLSGTDSYTGNTEDKVALDVFLAGINSPATIHKLDVPYKVVTSSFESSLSVDADLRIEPGTILEMGTGTGISVNENGSLYAVGTATEPIIMRGLVPTAGSWGRIDFNFTNSPLNQLAYMTIQHATQDPGNSKGAIYTWAEATVNVANVHFDQLLGCAIYTAPSSSSPNPNLTTSGLTYGTVGGQICGD